MPERAQSKVLRCAIYTRKSSEEGLEQDFNSLQAQREACEAYVASQKHEGWKVLKAAYDDGAYSGGTMERPALKRLLTDIAAGRIDVVVVYKVDRLTRALADFAKIVETFDQNGVSFVSVTQQFNTTTSMGRLTLNVLLSFAQFEREVTGERIRDKIAASKKKGLWMGGFVPIGYRASGRTLVIYDDEAKVVRKVFGLYLRLGSVLKLEAELLRLGIQRPPSRTMTSKRLYGARPFMRGELYKLLANRIYVGEIHHHGLTYEGQHPAIIDRALWAKVRDTLAANAHERHIGRGDTGNSLLKGLLFAANGNRLTPTHTVKNGRRYRYYVLLHSTGAVDENSRGGGKPRFATLRIPAPEIEATLISQLSNRLANPHWLLKHIAEDQRISDRKAIIAKGRNTVARLKELSGAELRSLILELIRRITVTDRGLCIEIRHSHLTNMSKTSGPSSADDHRPQRGGTLQIHVPIVLGRRGQETKLIVDAPDESQNPRKADGVLVKLIANARRWWDDLNTGRYSTIRSLAKAYGKDERYVARVMPLAFLASPIIEDIVAGQQPIELTAQRLITFSDLPHSWAAQVAALRQRVAAVTSGRERDR